MKQRKALFISLFIGLALFAVLSYKSRVETFDPAPAPAPTPAPAPAPTPAPVVKPVVPPKQEGSSVVLWVILFVVLAVVVLIVIGMVQNFKRLKLAGEAAAKGDYASAAALGTAGTGGYNYNRGYNSPSLFRFF
jgi:hypothetical protein